MKNLYSVVEGILDDDFMDVADDRVKLMKKYAHSAAIYNISMSSEYIMKKVNEKYHLSWQKGSDERHDGLKWETCETIIEATRYENDEITYDFLFDTMLEAKKLPNHIELPDKDYHVWIEDFVDEHTALVVPCMRVEYKDNRGKSRNPSICMFWSTYEPGFMKIIVIGKNLKPIK